ncbi:Lrp/AsnC family transcriptional regulator [Thalassococcus sp. S3]|uniref:Lrp/AsnC family transcriptional regulator n=1 Tax=Thalassococcus sp. S3 TaxID=2017482 RepID=UPI0010244CEF|nr:Lrp/AsnC family transcriptional regulator [Thalassococcus sp. S3]QBF31579.1 AsnC family transcriptional regulator [Thalassococcus sp. S3]
MAVKTDNLRRRAGGTPSIDGMDTKILGVLARDALKSYAEIGETVGLSAPAVHERVKRLRASGVISETVARLDGPAVGKPLLAFVHVSTTGWGKTRAMVAMQDFPEVEELHSVTGDACLIIKVRVASALALEGLLSRIYDVEGVRETRTYVTLSTHLERSVQAELTDELEENAPYLK